MNNIPASENSELDEEFISPSEQVGHDNLLGLVDQAESYHEKIDITPENTREYWKNRMQENVDLLKDKAPYLEGVYTNIAAEDPGLKIVKLTDKNIKGNAYFSTISLLEGNFMPEVALNLNNQETYIGSNLEFMLRQLAIQLGAEYEDIKDNKKLVTTFIFLHEFGHAKDFIDNYLKPKENKGKKSLAEALENATTEKQKHRLRDIMTMPLPSHIDFSKQEDRKKYRKRLESFGVKPDSKGHTYYKQVRIVQSNAYREMSSESYADTFARDYIMKHRDEYFLPLGTQHDYSGRIKTGGEIMMEDEDIMLAGIRDGKNITVKKIAQNGHSDVPIGYEQAGFLDGQFLLGGSMKLVKDIDDSQFLQTSPIQSMNRRMLADGSTLFTAKTFSGATYEIIRNKEVKPEPITKTVEEMNKALGIRVGSEVILMKRNIKNQEDSAVVIGQTLQGILESTPKSGKAVFLRNKNGVSVANTSPIVEVRRIWRSWWFRTLSDSIYEVVPTE